MSTLSRSLAAFSIAGLCTGAQASQAQARPMSHGQPIPVPGVHLGDNIVAASAGARLVVAWSRADTLHVVRMHQDAAGVPLASIALSGTPSETRITQLVWSAGDTVIVVMSDRRTRFIIDAGGSIRQDTTPMVVEPDLRRFFSPVGLAGPRSHEQILLMPLLMPTSNFGREHDALLLGSEHRWNTIDSVHLGQRIVQVQMPQGPAVLYDSPIRTFHDLGTRVAIAGDAGGVALVDMVETPAKAHELLVRWHGWTTPAAAQVSPAMHSWTRRISLPALRISIDERAEALDSVASQFRARFLSDADAKEAFESLVRVGAILPSVRTIRASSRGVLVELLPRFAGRAGLRSLMLVTADRSCEMSTEPHESIVALSESHAWTVGSESGQLTVRAHELC